MHRRHEVGAGLALDRHPLPGERREEARGVGHHVADHRRVAGHAFGRQRLARSVVGTQEERRDPVDLDSISLLRHRKVAAAEPRLDVGDRNPGLDSGLRSGERRVRVAEDEHPVGSLALEHGQDLRLHQRGVGGSEIERVERLGQPELVVEHGRHRPVVVLAGVERDLLDSSLSQGQRERRRLDELRPVSDDGEHLHARLH